MKKSVFILFAFAVQMSLFAQEYYPEGTKWTEIRLDTMKYDSWYSKVGDEWVPNFETIEYHVQGEFIDERTNDKYSCVYTNGQERTDSLTLLLYNHRIGNNDAGWYGEVTVAAFDNNGQLLWPFYGQMYPLSYEVGTPMSSLNILIAGATGGGWPWEWDEYGTVEEIKEGDFGGVRPLKYSDVNGIRFIQGIGVASWNDGECIFGPIRPYEVLSHLGAVGSDNRHYRSMLVHFERDGEVLYDVWPRKGSTVEVAIDGLNYFLYLDRHEAVLTSRNNCSGEVDIPSEVRYNDETFVVKSMTHTAFHNNSELTKVRIPKTIEEIIHYYPVDPDWLDPPTGMANPIYVNPFKGCTALESIEVDEENPCMKSIDGVLFSQDGVGQYYYKTGSYSGTGLYCYPEGVRQESYTIPESVEWIGGAAFPNNQYLTTLTIPNSMKHICYDAFSGCCNLTDVYCYAENVPIAWDGAFRNVPIASATLHVPAGSIEEYKTTSPWSNFGNIVAIEEIAQEYFPEGTKWTEIRLDTKRFDSWYSKVGDEWVPNFETIEYRVQGEYTDHNLKFKKVYSNGPEWTDSLALLIYDNGYDKRVSASVLVQDLEYVLWPAEVYQFDWNIGIRLWFQDLLEANATCYPPCGLFNYGIIDEIKEGYFGGVRPLKYVDLNGKAPSDPKQPWLDYADTNGGRIIQGIGITEWNDGECLFGPPNPYSALSNYEYLPQRHYRSMLVHFESGGEVLYDVWPKKEAIEVESVAFTAGQMATIVLPTEPDAGKGKYYRLDRVEGNEIIFEQELQPRAHVPYIIVPGEDFSIEVDAMELDGLRCDTASVEGISFIGTFQKEEVESQEGFYIKLIDTTPDCSLSPSGEAGRDVYTIGTLRAYLLVHWDDPYSHGGTKIPAEKLEIVLHDDATGIESIQNSKFKVQNEDADIYDLSGRKIVNGKSSNSKFPRGIYIEGEKVKIY